VFNVKKYGAVGNGTTDDSNAILAAAAAANAVPGSTLLFPQGNYLIDGIVTVQGIEVVGDGATLTTSSTGGLEVTGSNTKVYDMRFETRLSAGSGAAGILVNRANGFEIRNNTLSGFTDAVSVTQSSSGKVNANKIFMSNGSIAGVAVGNSSIISLQRNSVSGVTNGAAFLPSNSNNITIDSNEVIGVGYCIDSNRNTIITYSNNSVTQVQKDGIDLNLDRNAIVTGNSIFDPGEIGMTVSQVTNAEISSNRINLQLANYGISLGGGSSLLDITGNNISNARFDAIAGGGVSRLSILNNTLSDCLGKGINLNGNSTSQLIQGNQISKMTSTAIVTTNCTGVSQINKNAIRDCGSLGISIPAVIYVNSPAASGIQIVFNTYHGKTSGLQYFIWCVQPEPPAQILGNITNTGLPNRIGS
jgi:hypothetical protein